MCVVALAGPPPADLAVLHRSEAELHGRGGLHLVFLDFGDGGRGRRAGPALDGVVAQLHRHHRRPDDRSSCRRVEQRAHDGERRVGVGVVAEEGEGGHGRAGMDDDGGGEEAAGEAAGGGATPPPHRAVLLRGGPQQAARVSVWLSPPCPLSSVYLGAY